MNSLGWFLYMADVLPKLSGIILNAAIAFLIISTVVGLFLPMILDILEISPNDVFSKIPIGKIITAFLVAVLVAALIPSKQTFYLIAGSEAGETIAMSDSGQEIINDIQAIIKQQLKDMKEQN